MAMTAIPCVKNTCEEGRPVIPPKANRKPACLRLLNLQGTISNGGRPPRPALKALRAQRASSARSVPLRSPSPNSVASGMPEATPRLSRALSLRFTVPKRATRWPCGRRLPRRLLWQGTRQAAGPLLKNRTARSRRETARRMLGPHARIKARLRPMAYNLYAQTLLHGFPPGFLLRPDIESVAKDRRRALSTSH